jgi:hypothetical protein
MRSFVALVAVILLGLVAPSRAQDNQAPRVDHTTVGLFDSIPAQYRTSASNLRLLFVNRSVGKNIDFGLDCLSHPYGDAPNYCKRWQHSAPEFSSPESRWTGTYPRTRWHFGSWPGTTIPVEISCGGVSTAYWYEQLDCFIRHIDANPTAYDVATFQFSYLEVTDQSDIVDPARGFFGSNPPAGRKTVADLQALRSRHPNIRFVLMTTSLGRSIGTPPARDFNNALRTYAQTNGWPLFDFAAMISHSPTNGQPCYDNRDGVPYVMDGVLRENFPDDGVAVPAICQHYTGDVEGGHLITPGMIRAAKSWWILMARMSGWNPDGSAPVIPLAPRNLRIVGGV